MHHCLVTNQCYRAVFSQFKYDSTMLKHNEPFFLNKKCYSPTQTINCEQLFSSSLVFQPPVSTLKIMSPLFVAISHSIRRHPSSASSFHHSLNRRSQFFYLSYKMHLSFLYISVHVSANYFNSILLIIVACHFTHLVVFQITIGVCILFLVSSLFTLH